MYLFIIFLHSQYGRLFLEVFLKLAMPLLDYSFKKHKVRIQGQRDLPEIHLEAEVRAECSSQLLECIAVVQSREDKSMDHSYTGYI